MRKLSYPLIFALFLLVVSARAEAALSINVLGGVIQNLSADCYSYIPNHQTALTEEFIGKVNPAVRERIGIVSDGNARLVIRVQSPRSEDITLTANLPPGAALENIKRTALGSRLTVKTELVGAAGKYQGSAVLTAPEEWPGDDTQEFFPITVTASQGEESISKEIKIYRAPVVLVHGLWSDGETFGDINDEQTVAGALFAKGAHHGYFEYPGDQGPSEVLPQSADIFCRAVENMIRDLRMKKIEATRVDLVGHSMGGLMARKFFLNRYYRNNQNYNQGAVRRIVMLATPNTGSGIASYVTEDVLWLHDDTIATSPDYREKMEQVFEIMGRAGMNVKGSAIKDLALNSSELRLLNDNLPAGLPLYRIAGDTGEALVMPGAVSKIIEGIIAPYTHEKIYNDIPALFDGYNNNGGRPRFEPEDSDCLVGLSSALWDGVMSRDKSEIIKGRQHMGMGADATVASRVAALLCGPVSAFEPIPQRSQLRFPDQPSPSAVKGSVGAMLSSLSDAEFTQKLGELESLLENRNTKAEGLVFGKLTGLSCYPESPVLISAGTTRRLSISGSYSTGKRKNVSHKKDGTKYEVADASVALVDEDGMLTALKPGRTTLTVKNGSISATADIFVIPFAVVAADDKVDPDNPPVDPADEINPDTPRGSSSSGCNTGAGLVLLLLPALAFIIKKS